MQADLSPDTKLFAGRYIIAETATVNPYGFTYKAFDRSTDSQVYIQEFFPHTGCIRNPQTSDMSIRREDAPKVSAQYKEFTRYVTRLMEGSVPGGQKLIHAFKDHGTAYYVTAEDDSASLRPAPRQEAPAQPRAEQPARQAATPRPVQAPAQPKPAAAAHPIPTTRPATAVRPAETEPEKPRRAPSAREKAAASNRARTANYRNAILWYRIVIFLLLCIVLLLVYLTFLSPSPKVKSAHSPAAAPIENTVAQSADASN